MNGLLKRRQAFAIFEYLVMVIIIIVAFIGFRFYVQHGYQGQMARTGESFAFGRQYDPRDTIVCKYDGFWFSEACYKHRRAEGMTVAAARSACTAGCQQN